MAKNTKENEKTTFMVFKYEFSKIRNLVGQEGILPFEFDVPMPSFLEMQNDFAKILPSMLSSAKMNIVETKKNQEEVIHDNRILGFREDVAVLDICADKRKIYWSGFVEKEVRDEPFCKVIIDNRPNKGYIFIETSSIFGSRKGEDKVVRLLRDSINQVANQYGWTMNVYAKLPSADLFDEVAKRISQGDIPRSMTYSFPKHQTHSDAPKGLMEAFSFQYSLMECTNSAKFTGKLEADRGKSFVFDKRHKMLALLVNFCSKEDYGVTISYWKGKSTSTESLKRTRVPIPNGEVDAFVLGVRSCFDSQGNSGFPLINTLDMLLNQMNDNSYEAVEI